MKPAVVVWSKSVLPPNFKNLSLPALCNTIGLLPPGPILILTSADDISIPLV